jgi:hypothetical protein
MFETQRGQTMKNSIICPNKNDPAWKRLVAEIGEDRAYIAFFRNGDVIPDVVTARALLFRKSPTLPAPEPETKPAATPSPAPKFAPEQTLAKSKLVKATVPKAAIQFRRAGVPKIKAENFATRAAADHTRAHVCKLAA